MIQIRSKIGSVAPAILTVQGVVATNANKATFDGGSVIFTFNPAIYGHKTVKDELIRLQSYKCCFCEGQFGAHSHGDVEHFRPKAGWVQDDETVNQPGYYWLAYDWDNLLLSCQKCNQRYKKNYFPLRDNTQRALNHNQDVAAEQPMFIHPVNDIPEDHIEFNENEAIAKTDRGTATITKLGLNRDILNEDRRKQLERIKVIYQLAKKIAENEPEERDEAIAIVQEKYNEAQKDSTEYASMLRCFFKKYPINF